MNLVWNMAFLVLSKATECYYTKDDENGMFVLGKSKFCPFALYLCDAYREELYTIYSAVYSQTLLQVIGCTYAYHALTLCVRFELTAGIIQVTTGFFSESYFMKSSLYTHTKNKKIKYKIVTQKI